MPRVSEYMPEIVAYISTIIEKGLAYKANGSVYFDTCAFECAHCAGWEVAAQDQKCTALWLTCFMRVLL
jgi:cysteinyl-tRNA synthetase